MENHINQFTKSAHEVRLDDGALARLRLRLLMYVRAHPVAPSPYQRFFLILSPYLSVVRKPVVVVPLLFLLVAGGGTTYAALDAMPGDALYAMKVGAIEPMRGLFALSPEARAEWEVSLTETRLAELEKLVEEGNLTADQTAEGQERLDRAIEAVQDALARLSLKNPESAARIKGLLSASLVAHENKLMRLIDSATTTSVVEIQSFTGHFRAEIMGNVKGVATTSTDRSKENGRDVNGRPEPKDPKKSNGD